MIIDTPLVSTQWLYENLKVEKLIIFDATMKKVTDSNDPSTSVQIPNARFFDIKNVFSNTNDPFPNAVPSEEQFTTEVQKLGVNNDSFIVVYDDKGIYSCARVWWLFKAFGFNNIAVLDGGLPEWISTGFPTEEKQIKPIDKGNLIGKYQPEFFQFFDDILQLSSNENCLILDARGSDRFYGLVEEPREGLRSGHIPNSKNLPYSTLFNGNLMKSKEELQQVFSDLITNQNLLVFSCGSGITACIIALAATIADYDNLSVYDGSWTEYGSLTKK